MFSRPILPIGTQVVVHVDIHANNGDVLFAAGAVGLIIKAPTDATHAYRVRFMDNSETSLKRQEFSIRAEHQAMDARQSDVNLYEYVIFRCVVGSRAYHLHHDQSDVDTRGIYLPPSDLQWSLFGVPEQLESDAEQSCFWELQKFIVLALKANPNILECLYSPLVEYVTPLMQELLDQRQIFLSKLIYQTYNGYVMSQFKKLQYDIKNHGAIKWKHAMHLIRLLLAGITALQDQYVPVRVETYRQQLLDIRQGTVSWQEVDEWRLSLHKEFDKAFQTTGLPDRPHYEQANEFLLKARRSVI